jgi:hypothetical protein
MHENPRVAFSDKKIFFFCSFILSNETASVVEWSEFLATDPEVLDSILGASRFSEKWWVWNGVHSAS